jgi:glycosyltransferase involved in cell wall biosynthesis
MPVYNRAYCIEAAINSILKQTHKNWTLIIIDDVSNDNLKDVLSKYITDSRINLYHQKKKGVSSARNFGLDKTIGKYVSYLDSDNKWLPSYLKYMTVFMEKGELDCCYSGIKLIDDENSIRGYYGHQFNWNKCWEFNYIDINCFTHHKKFIDKGFSFDTNLKRLVDWDFILAVTSFNRASYAPFLGTEYYDGEQGNRITFNEYKGGDGYTGHIVPPVPGMLCHLKQM